MMLNQYPYLNVNGMPVVEPLFPSDSLAPGSPKKFQITECGVELACQLNGSFHSVLPKVHSSNIYRNPKYVCYAITFSGVYFGAAIWSTPVAANRLTDGFALLELRRLAVHESCPKNTCSFAISKMVKDIRKRFPDVPRLISYQAVNEHLGTIYAASNWTSVNTASMVEWDGKRKRAGSQVQSAKVRWEYRLHKCAELDGRESI